MAKVNPWHFTTDGVNVSSHIETKDYAIGGKLIQASRQIDKLQLTQFHNEDDYKRFLKMEMATELARVMIESNLIEFTKLTEPHSMIDKIFARCYLAPNDQVKILRTYGK